MKASTESGAERLAKSTALAGPAPRDTDWTATAEDRPAATLGASRAASFPAPLGTLRDDLLAQREFVRGRSLAYARLLELLEKQLDRGLEARLSEVWRERRFDAWYERPLLLANSLREDALRVGSAHPLWHGIAAPEPDPASIDEMKVADALASTRKRLWSNLASRHLQTNEPTRAVAWLWPTRIASLANRSRPIALLEMGASAGLNLIADHLPPIWQRQDGRPLEVKPAAPIASRIGFDLRPMDALDENDARWLRACVWPGQREREARLDAAIAAFRNLQRGHDAPVVRAGRAGAFPGQLPRGDDGQLLVVFQTIVRDYIPRAEWETYQSGLHRCLESRPPGSSIWVELEVTEAARRGGPPAALTVHVRGGGGLRSLLLAHCEPHPWRLDVNDAAVDQLRTELGAR